MPELYCTDPWRQNLTSEEEVFHLSIIISYQVVCECCPWIFHPCARTALCHFHQLPMHVPSLPAARECLLWLPRHVTQIHLPLTAWLLICLCIVYIVHGHFLLSSSYFATPRSIFVADCWTDLGKFIGKKGTVFSSLLISYALKFTPRWYTGKSELCYWARALIESFGTKCSNVISSMRQVAFLCYLHVSVHLKIQS